MQTQISKKRFIYYILTIWKYGCRCRGCVGVDVDVKAVIELVIVADVVILVGTIEEKYDESLILNM